VSDLAPWGIWTRATKGAISFVFVVEAWKEEEAVEALDDGME
jgi:hypothetical protein